MKKNNKDIKSWTIDNIIDGIKLPDLFHYNPTTAGSEVEPGTYTNNQNGDKHNIQFIKKRNPHNPFDNHDVFIKTDTDDINILMDIFEKFCQGCGFVINSDKRIGLMNGKEIDTFLETARTMAIKGKSFLPLFLKSANELEVELAKIFMEFIKEKEK